MNKWDRPIIITFLLIVMWSVAIITTFFDGWYFGFGLMWCETPDACDHESGHAKDDLAENAFNYFTKGYNFLSERPEYREAIQPYYDTLTTVKRSEYGYRETYANLYRFYIQGDCIPPELLVFLGE